MRGKESLFNIAEQILRAVKADGAEVLIFAEDSYLTRYANSEIHQNMAISNVNIGVRVRLGKKTGIAWANRDDRDSLLDIVRTAETLASQMPEDPDLPELFGRVELGEVEGAFVESTANLTPAERARTVSRVIEILRPFKAFGVYSSGISEIVYLNTSGSRCYHRVTDAHLSVNAMGEGGSGWAQISSRDASSIDPEDVARRARRKAELSVNPIDVEPGEYTVILEELAFSTLLAFMGFMGFSAKSYQEGRSFLLGRLGEKVFSENLTIYDDPLDVRGFPVGFDFEGVPKKKLVLVDKGVAKNLVYDLKTAAKDGKESTGHALMPFRSFPYPGHMVVKPGSTSIDEIIRSTERGILVTRFHYTNVIEPRAFVLTGMTRDGTFLIEDGTLVKGVKNLRFTDSMIDALSSVMAISKDLSLVSDTSWYGHRFPKGFLVPSVKLERFNFTGKTEF